MSTSSTQPKRPRRRRAQAARGSGKAFDPSVVKSQVSDAALVQRRREQIVAAAVELFAAQGYFRTTIQQIAREAGVSIGLIYQYAQTKDDVLLLSLMKVMDLFRQEISTRERDETDPLDALKRRFATYCRVVDRNRKATVLAYRSTMSLPAPMREFIKRAEADTNEVLADALRACVAEGLFRPIDVDLAAYQLVMHAHTWALKHWRLSRLTTIDGYVEQGFDFFVRAMATPAGLARHQPSTAAGAARTPGKRRGPAPAA